MGMAARMRHHVTDLDGKGCTLRHATGVRPCRSARSLCFRLLLSALRSPFSFRRLCFPAPSFRAAAAPLRVRLLPALSLTAWRLLCAWRSQLDLTGSYLMTGSYLTTGLYLMTGSFLILASSPCSAPPCRALPHPYAGVRALISLARRPKLQGLAGHASCCSCLPAALVPHALVPAAAGAGCGPAAAVTASRPHGKARAACALRQRG